MATVILTPDQATAIRRHIVTWSYGSALEEYAGFVTGSPIDEPGGIPRLPELRKPMAKLESALEQIGWEEPITGPVELEADEDDIRDWAVGGFDAARERLGEGKKGHVPRDQLAHDRQWLAEAEALLPLIESLEHRDGLEAA